MTLVYHHLIYMVFFKLVTVKESMISDEFALKLSKAKTDAQLDKLVDEIIEKQFPSPIKKSWNIPTLDKMEIEVAHLASFWNDKRVSLIRILEYSNYKLSSVSISCHVHAETFQFCGGCQR